VKRAAAICVAVAALAGCGGSSHNGSTSAATTTAPPIPSALAAHVLRAGELQGFAPDAPTAERDVSAWVTETGTPPGQAATEVARLKRLGFLAGVSEHLHPTGSAPADALSLSEQFTSAAAPRGELVQASKPPPGVKEARFPVAGIPGAVGYDLSSGGTAGHNVAFVDGHYYYLVGAGFPAGSPNPPTRAQVVAAAADLYRRVHGMGG